jgi:hypothetical protein
VLQAFQSSIHGCTAEHHALRFKSDHRLEDFFTHIHVLEPRYLIEKDRNDLIISKASRIIFFAILPVTLVNKSHQKSKFVGEQRDESTTLPKRNIRCAHHAK